MQLTHHDCLDPMLAGWFPRSRLWTHIAAPQRMDSVDGCMIVSQDRFTWRLLAPRLPPKGQEACGHVVAPRYGVKTSLRDEAEPPGVGPPETT
jgi:hypothetical protein